MPSGAYFEQFPLVNYNGTITRNIISRAKFIQTVIDNAYAFYDFVIKDSMTWAQIAHSYYGSENYDWICWFSNSVFDPYYEFPMDQETFDTYIAKKYGDFETAVTTVHHYTYHQTQVVGEDPNTSYTDGYEMSPTTYLFMSNVQKSYWKPVSVYDWEDAKNEAKRTIKLIDRRILPQVLKEIGEVMQ